jgi:hypothetical protein
MSVFLSYAKKGESKRRDHTRASPKTRRDLGDQTDKRGDIIYKYTKGQVGWLKRHDHLKDLEEEF